MSDRLYQPQRNWGARIREVIYRGIPMVIMENELLRIGIMAGRGTDIVELNFKPRDLDFVWLTPGGVRHAATMPAPALDSRAAFRDTYPGGWQELFPNAGLPAVVNGVEHPQHGEVFNVPWDVTIVEDTAEAVAVRFTVHTRKTPFQLEKTLRLETGEPGFSVSERVVNASPVPLRAMWGHHITYGAPFLVPGSRIRLPEGITAIPHPEAIAPGGRRASGTEPFSWPTDPGNGLDFSTIPERGAPSDVLYLAGFDPDNAWYEITRPDDDGGVGCRVEWDARQMLYLWFWQEFGASQAYPWYGRISTIGLEPCSSYPNTGLADAVANGTALHLPPGEERENWLRFIVLV